MRNNESNSLRAGLLIVLFFVSGYTTFAQSVDMLTGRLQMSVPLGQLQANDISIPIGLYNSGEALKVTAGEGDCGLGWGLSAGGAISRLVRGLPDEINSLGKQGWLYSNNAQDVQSFSPTADDNLANCDEDDDWNSLNAIIGSYANDTEPDLFYIHAPGLSAQFIFATDGAPKLLIHQDIIIEYDPNTIVVKSNGLVYTFSTKETVTRRASVGNATYMNTDCNYFKDDEYPFTSQWKLTSISSGVTGTQAQFYYTSIADEAGRRFFSLDSLNYIVDSYSRKQLSYITLKSFRADFTWSNSLLQRVAIAEEKTLDKKEFSLEYKSASHTGSEIFKSFLTGVRFHSANCLTFDKYSFEYLRVTQVEASATKPSDVNWKGNSGQDFFGYPNGEVSNWNLPQLYAYYSESDSRRLRVHYFGTPSASISGHDRSPNATYAYGALTKIGFPTGGYAEIQYEANKYIDNSTSQELTGNGLRVKKLISQGGEVAYGKTISATNAYRAVVREYEYTNAAGSLSSGVLLSPVKLGYITRTGIKQAVDNIGEDDPAVMYTRVKEKVAGQGSTVYEFSVPGVFPETSSGDWKASKSRIARALTSGCVSAGNIKNGYYTFPYAPSTNYNFERGQLTKVTEYTETGTAIREKNYTYQRKTTNPSTIKGLRFELIESVYHYSLYEMITGNMEVISQETVKEASHEATSNWFETTTAYTYKSNHRVDCITTTLPDSKVTSQCFKYASDFPFTSPPSSDTAAVAIKVLNDNNRGGAIVEQITRVTVPGPTTTITGAQLVIYRNFTGTRVYPYYSKILPPGATLNEASMNGQTFEPDTEYRLVSTFKDYDEEGRVLSATDDKRNWVATHYAKEPSFPVATFSNLRAQQSVCEGFEMDYTFGLTTSGTGFEYPAGWTGEKAIRFTNNTSKLVSSATNLIPKSGNTYRVSCWVYGPVNKTITINAKNGSTTVSTSVLTNPVNNQWNYIEKEMDVTSAPSTFTIEIITNASTSETVILDDIIFMPLHGRVALRTIMPFKGVTSVTDDKGNSVKTTYDASGRVFNVLDRDRNLVQRSEYSVLNTKPGSAPWASFSPDVQQYVVNSAITFTPDSWTCDSGNTYAWQVDGVTVSAGSGNVLVHTFTTPGQHSVKLTVTNSLGSSSITRTYCVEYQLTGSFSVSITDQNGNPITSFDCNSVPSQINVNFVTPAGFPSDCLVNVSWSSSNQPDGSGGTTYTHTATYQVNCDYFTQCTFTSPINVGGQVSNSYTNAFNPNCQ